MRKWFLSFLLLFLSVPSFIQAQCLLKPSTLNQRLAESEVIVEGEVIGQHSFWDGEHRLIYTAHSIRVYKVFKGQLNTPAIEIVTPGGIVGNEGLEVNPALRLSLQSTGVFMLRVHPAQGRLGRGQSTLYQPIAAQASMIAYEPDFEKAAGLYEKYEQLEALYEDLTNRLGRKPVMVQELPEKSQRQMAPSITSLSTYNSSAGHGELLAISGTGFGGSPGVVFFDSPDDGPGGSYIATPSDEILSWSNTLITVEIPGGAGTGGVIVQDAGGSNSGLSSTLTINFNISNHSSGDSIMLVDDGADGDGGYTFYFSTETANSGVSFTTEASGAALAAFERAVDSWQIGTDFSIYTGSGCVTSLQAPGLDGTNIVAFDNDTWDLDVEASSSTLGVCYNYFSRCGSSEWEYTDKDLIFRRDGNPNGSGGSVNWEWGTALPGAGESDFESVSLHELGHVHGLGHINSSGAVMHYSITTGSSNRTLSAANEIAGGTEISDNSVFYNPPLILCGGEWNSARDYLDNGGGVCTALPVELIQFNAHQYQQHVLLTWKTASEWNNRLFVIERSADGRRFEELGKLDGAENTESETSYQLTDDSPLPGTNYYRLKQFDWDGHEEILGVKSVEFRTKTNFHLFPNPISGDQLQLLAELNHPSDLQIKVLDITGRELYCQTMASEKGNHMFWLDLPDLSAGIYFCQILSDNHLYPIRFVKE